MLIAGLDTETTGLDPAEDRIIEAYIGLWDFSTRTKVEELNLRIQPNRSIAAAAQAVHGISLLDLAGCPVFADVGADIRATIDKSALLVWHNGEGFDRAFLDAEFKRAGLPPISQPGVDTMLEGRWATPVGAVPNLGALCWACEVPYDSSKAHAAEYDVDVMMECFFRGVDWGFFSHPLLTPRAVAA